MKRVLIAVLALFAGAAPAAVLAATDSKSNTASTTTTSTKAKTTTTTTTTTTTKPKTTTAKTTTTTSTSTTTSTKPPVLIGGTVLLGATRSPVVPPTCATSSCNIILTRVTAMPTIRDGKTYPTKVKTAGTIVAFTLGLAKIAGNGTQTAHQVIAGLDARFGGVTQAGLAVLKPAPGKNPTRVYSVVTLSPLFHLQPYLGYNVQFPLPTPIAVTPGEVVALTVPTWAPVISYNLPLKQFAYRQSRNENCSSAGSYQNAQAVGQSHEYKCDYPGARLEYNVTELTTPPPPKNYVH